jgi:UDP-N-acetylglucosamine diphosphorylase / glucose-1-phosphate thymidylyltransferase / UDP-N-acetylgalactosamine diphosphorylase / glucosamine-1-phosphate N-acetyltransferase / galactosamine-1-phosphate N-acetyltransferase
MAKMRKFIITDSRFIAPFNEPAREMRVLNKPLKLAQRDALVEYCDTEIEVESLKDVPRSAEEMIVHRDNLYFDEPFVTEFVTQARKTGLSCRAAFKPSDKAFTAYALPLTQHIHAEPRRDSTGKPVRDNRGRDVIDHYEIDLWYFPRGYQPESPIVPIYVSSGWTEIGYYSVPEYMSGRGDLTHYLTKRTMLSIENWVHVFYANVILGIFSIGHRFEARQAESNLYRLKILWKALLEQTQVLSCSELVQIGKDCDIDPSAVIQGPTIIGDNCTIGPGAVIGNCYIGNNVNIAQGCNLMLSVVNDNCFLPFRSSLFMTVLMENSIVAQNTCLQMCVVGRNSFVGAGNTFTDFNLLPTPLKLEAADGSLERVGQMVLGGCVGHNCRLGSGLVIYPARMIESDVILFATPSRRVIKKNISYEESDHHDLRPEIARLHKRKYPRRAEQIGEEAYLESW